MNLLDFNFAVTISYKGWTKPNLKFKHGQILETNPANRYTQNPTPDPLALSILYSFISPLKSGVLHTQYLHACTHPHTHMNIGLENYQYFALNFVY